jgi:hypothetical protein
MSQNIFAAFDWSPIHEKISFPFDAMPLRHTAFHMWMFDESRTNGMMIAAIRALVLLALVVERRKIARIHTGEFIYFITRPTR